LSALKHTIKYELVNETPENLRSFKRRCAAVIWLHTNNFPGISALCSYLGNADGKPRTYGACFILAGCALIDGAMASPVQPGEVM
jgi:hypothetical protein